MATVPRNENVQAPKVNIAGDFSVSGLDISPNEPYISRGSLRPNGGGGVQFKDEVPPSGEPGKATPKVDFPVDE